MPNVLCLSGDSCSNMTCIHYSIQLVLIGIYLSETKWHILFELNGIHILYCYVLIKVAGPWLVFPSMLTKHWPNILLSFYASGNELCVYGLPPDDAVSAYSNCNIRVHLGSYHTLCTVCAVLFANRCGCCQVWQDCCG